MKQLFLLVIVLGSVALLANPAPYMLFSEYWFDDEWDMFIELSSNFGQQNQNMYLRFNDGTNVLELDQPIAVPRYPEAMYFNLSQALPALNLSRWGGQLTVEYRDDDSLYIQVGHASWNGGNSPIYGKSLVNVYDVSSGYDPDFVWTIEVPPTPGTNPYNTYARATLNVTCLNQNGNPVADVLVYVSSHHSNSGYTDADGFFSLSCMCHPIRVCVRHPQTNELVYDEVHNFYPGSVGDITVQITTVANNDPNEPTAPLKGLEAFPNPFIPRNHEMISLRFDGDQEVLSGAEVIVYNLRGQEVARVPMHSGRESNWIPEEHLPSGLYLMELVNNHKNYGTQTIRILK